MTTTMVIGLQDQLPLMMESIFVQKGKATPEEVQEVFGESGPPIYLKKEVTLTGVVVYNEDEDEDEDTLEDLMSFKDSEAYIDEEYLVWFSPNFGPIYIEEEDWADDDRELHGMDDHNGDLAHPRFMVLGVADSDEVGTESEALELLLNEGWGIIVEVEEA